MKLKSFGCSFIFGTDLPNDGRHAINHTPSHCAYPALIAKKMGLDWSCHARPSAGNFEILHNIINQIASGDPMIAVVNWTWIDRFSYIDRNWSLTQCPVNPLGWQSVLPNDRHDERTDFYFRHLHSQVCDKLQSLICIKNAIDCLIQSGNSFIMTWTDDLLWETQWHCPPSVEWLQKQVKPYMTDFAGKSFVQWSRDLGHPISDTMHPLISAHQDAANYLFSNWTEHVRP